MKKFCALSAAMISLLLFSGAAFAAMVTEFSAVTVESENGTVRKGNIYITKDKTRSEWDNGSEIVVTRHDKKVVWFIYPKLKCYIEEQDTGKPSGFGDADPTKPPETAGDLTRKFVGFEMRDSYRMRKYLITVNYSHVSGKDSYYEWRRDDFPVPVRTESPDGRSFFEYTKIKRGTQNPYLFTKPEHYKKVTYEEFQELMKKYEDIKNSKKKK